MKSNAIFQATLAYVLLSVLVSCAPVNQKPDETTNVPVETSGTQTGSRETSDSSPVSYSETVEYKTPAGLDKVTFAITVDKGLIASVSVTPGTTNEVSKKLQGSFGDAAGTQIVGKPLATLDIKAVGGASLTTEAFKQFAAAAVTKIAVN